MYLFVHVIKMLLTQYDRMAAMGELVTFCAEWCCEEDREGAMASKREGVERREAESSMLRVKSSRFFSSDMLKGKEEACVREGGTEGVELDTGYFSVRGFGLGMEMGWVRAAGHLARICGG